MNPSTRSALGPWTPTFLTPAWRQWLQDQTVAPPAVRQVGPGAFEVKHLFSPHFLALLADEAHTGLRMRQQDSALHPPNSMHRAGYVLAQRGLGPLLDELGSALIGPLGRWCYPDRNFGDIFGVHGFVAHYGPDGDPELGFHVDESDLTLTLCLGDSFSGSAVYFEGLRCGAHLQTPVQPEEPFDYTPTPGVALLHLGAHRHGVRPIASGSRTSMILWARGDSPHEGVAHGRAGPCPTWCGVHPRR